MLLCKTSGDVRRRSFLQASGGFWVFLLKPHGYSIAHLSEIGSCAGNSGEEIEMTLTDSAIVDPGQGRSFPLKHVVARDLAKALFAVALAVSLSGAMYAQETEASGTAVKTYVKTSSAPLSISTELIQAVTPTAVRCPAKCALEIRFDTQLNALTPGDPNVVAVVVHVDGSVSNIAPNSALGFDSTSTGGGSNTRSFTWLASKLGAGRHIVDILLYVPEGSAGSANRTLTVHVIAHDNESD